MLIQRLIRFQDGDWSKLVAIAQGLTAKSGERVTTTELVRLAVRRLIKEQEKK